MTRTRISDHDGAVSESRDVLKDLKERLREGEFARVEEALGDHPEIAGDDEAVLELILVEMAARDARGEPVSIVEWEARLAPLFPNADRREMIRRVLTSEMETLSESTAEDAAATSTPRATLARVGQYQLLEEIGRGGMGVVYKARQLNLNRIIALKMTHGGDRAGPRERARLRNEAEAAARISHPNIVQIIESGEHQGLPFLAMEHVDGGNLARMLRSAPQPIRWASRLAETLARAIHVAHRTGIVHRDLNPANILMTQKGAPKIGDFGLAKSPMAEEVSLDGVMLGTPSYMAPEQIADGGRDVGPATDVYALGAVLYEMLTGSPPFRGLTPMETLCQVAEGEVVLPSKLRRGLPADLETICLKCLERDPAQRYASAGELADDLRRFLNRQPIRARRASRRRRALRWAQREPLAAGLLALCLTLLGAFLGAVALHGAQLREYARELERQAGMLSGSEYMMAVSKQTMARAELLAQRRWRGLALGRIYDQSRRGRTEVALELLDQLGPSATGTDDFAWRRVNWLLGRSALVLGGEAHHAPVERLAASDDGRTLVTGDAEGRVVRWSFDGDRFNARRLTTAGPLSIQGLAIAPDKSGAARTIAAIGVDNERAAVLNIWDATQQRPLRIFRHALSEAADLAFSHAGDRLAFRRRSVDDLEWGIRLYKLQDGEWIEETPKPTIQGATRLLFSPAANLLATGRADGSVRMLDLDSGLETTLATPAGALPQTLAFSADGERLAVGCDDRTIWVWDVESGALITSVDDLGAPAGSLAFPIDGALLLIREENGAVSTLDLRESPPPRRRPLETIGRRATLATVSPDGRQFALGFADDRSELWSADDLEAGPRPLGELAGAGNIAFGPDGRMVVVNHHDALSFALKTNPEPIEPKPIAGHVGAARAVAFSPDGAILASSGDDRRIKLWDVAGGAKLGAIRAHDQSVSGLAFSPQTGELASAGLDGSLKVWAIARDASRTVAALNPLGELRPSGPFALRRAAYSSDGALLAAAGDGPEILIFDRTGDRSPFAISSGHRAAVTDLSFSTTTPPRLATASLDASLRIWDPTTGALLDAKRAGGGLLALAHAPNIKPTPSLLIAAGERRVVNAWDARTRDEVETLRGHPRAIRALAFSPDGLIFATGCDDGVVRLCDAMTHQIVLSMEGHRSAVTALAFSPDGSALASSDADGKVIIWRAGASKSKPTAMTR